MSVSQDTTYPSGAANTGDMNDAIPMRGLNPPAPRAEIFRGQPVTSSQELDTEDTRSSSSDPRNVRLWRLVEQFELENQIVYPDPEDKAVVANLATLQRIILCDLRDQLIQEIGAIKNNMFASQPFGPGWRSQTTSTGAKKPDSSGEENAKRLKNIKPLMKEYAQAIRDWDLMVEHAAKAGKTRSQDPYLLSCDNDFLYKSMKDAGLQRYMGSEFREFDIRRLRKRDHKSHLGQLKNLISRLRRRYRKAVGTETAEDFHGYHDGDLYETEKLPFDQRTRINNDRSVKAFLQRLVLALFGGVVLVGPMLLMVLLNNQTVSLTTTSVAVFVFALVVSAYSNGPAEGVVGVVAAYAAVMVVFVGASK